MKFILQATDKVVKLKLVKDRTRNIKQGFPWIYRDWLEDSPPGVPGQRAMVKDRDGALLAFGMYDPKSPLAVRICAVEKEVISDELIGARMTAALEQRTAHFDKQTSGFRLFNGEGDRLPGLVCDRYGQSAVIKLDGETPAGFWNTDGIGRWLVEHAGIETIFLRERGKGEDRGKIIHGAERGERASFLENGLRFESDLIRGQKTGFFFDQRDNRARIGALSREKTVLNLFGYTGGFSVYAGAGGAKHVTTVDLAKPAIKDAEVNWKLNDLPSERHTAVAADVFEYLKEVQQAPNKFDLIIVDPPSFASAEKHVEAAKASYQKVFTAALQVLEKGGLIAFSSCSSHISMETFMELCRAAVSGARRRALVRGVYGQPFDHPFPLACSELQYLKFVLLQVE